MTILLNVAVGATVIAFAFTVCWCVGKLALLSDKQPDHGEPPIIIIGILVLILLAVIGGVLGVIGSIVVVAFS